MKRACGIYKITSPSGKIYVGQSVNIYQRWRDHKRSNIPSRLTNSFKKYGSENHLFEIVHQCEREKLNELEKHYVDLFKTFNTEHGLNLKDGGGNYTIASEESKQKMREIRAKQIITKETKEKTRKTLLGHTMSEESRKKSSLSHTGHKWSPEQIIKRTESRRKNGWNKRPKETKIKQTEWQKGRKPSPEIVAKRVEAKRIIRQERLTMIF